MAALRRRVGPGLRRGAARRHPERSADLARPRRAVWRGRASSGCAPQAAAPAADPARRCVAGRRAEQHVAGVRRPADPQVLPPARRRREPGAGDGPLPDRQGRVPRTSAAPARSSTGSAEGAAATVAVLHRFVTNEGDAWRLHPRRSSRAYLASVAAARRGVPGGRRLPVYHCSSSPAAPRRRASPTPWVTSSTAARLLGQRTGELHLALAVGRRARLRARAVHAPVPALPLPVMRSGWSRLQSLRRARLSGREGPVGECVAREREILETAASAWSTQDRRRHGSASTATTTWARCCTPAATSSSSTSRASPARPLAERRLKRSPLRGRGRHAPLLPLRGGHGRHARARHRRPGDHARVGRPSGTGGSRRRSCVATSTPAATPASSPADPRTRGALLSTSCSSTRRPTSSGTSSATGRTWVTSPARGILELLATEPS